MRLLSALMLALTLTISLVQSVDVAAAQQSEPKVASAEIDFRSWLKSMEGDGTKATIGSADFDASSNVLNITNLVISSVSSGRTITQFAATKVALVAFIKASDGYRFSAARLEGITLGSAVNLESAVTMDRLEIGASFIPNITDFKADPARPVTSQIRLLTLLSKASLASVTGVNVAAGGMRAERIEIDAVSAGKIDQIETSGVNYNLKPLANGAVQGGDDGVSIAKLALTHIDIGVFTDLFDESAYLSAGASKPWNNIVEAIGVSKLVYKNGSDLFQVDQVDLGPLRVRQFPQYITAIFDKAALDQEYFLRNPPDAKTVSDAVRQSFSFESGHAEQLNMSALDKDGNMSISLGSASFSNLSATHADRVEIENAKVGDPGGTIAVHTLQLTDIDLAAMQQVATSAVPQPQAEIATPTVGKLLAEGLDLRVGPFRFAFEKLDVAMSYFVGATPTNVKVELSHATFPVEQITDAGMRQTLTDLGYKDLNLSLDVSGSWQDSASAIAFDTIRLTALDMGTLDLSGSLTGITRKGIESPRSILGSEIMAGGLQNFRASFENQSLFERVITQIARANNKNPDELKSILSANMPAILAQIASPAIRNRFVFAAVSFINTPKIFELATTTSDPTPIHDIIAAMHEPYKLPTVLKLDVSANDRK